MSLLMEALRKAEQGQGAESDVSEEVVALAAVEEDQLETPDDELLSLDLSDDTHESLDPVTVAVSEQESARVVTPVYSPAKPPVGENVELSNGIAAHESSSADAATDTVHPVDAVSVSTPEPQVVRKPAVIEEQPLLETPDEAASVEDTGTAEMAEILFQAKRGSRKELRLVLTLLIMVLLCIAGLGGWYYFILEGEEGQFQSASPVVAASRNMETEPALPAAQRLLPEKETPAPADVADTATTVVQPSEEESGAQSAKPEVVKTTESVPAPRLVKNTEKQAADVPTAAFNQQLATTLPPVKTKPTAAAPKHKAPASAQAVYQNAMDRQAQTQNQAPIEIRHSRKRVSRSVPLNQAWSAFNAHRYQDADRLYQAILDREPLNRDALLGHAAVAMRLGQAEQAVDTYMKLLERDPHDPLALAGLISLRGQQQPSQSLARLQQLITTNPDVAGLHFVLGNLYAGQSRWAYAQQAFFKAYSGEPTHPEYLFNLAVSLDHLGKKTQSLQFYRMAVDRAKQRPVKFSVEAVNARIAALEAGA